MKHYNLNKIISFVICMLLLFTYSNCGKSTISASNVPPGSATNVLHTPTLPITGNEPYVVPITLDGSGYINEPTISVTICSPGTTNCQTIPKVLVDTGSYGLRLFSSVVSTGLGLTQLSDNQGRKIAECVQYADGSSQWGPVVRADVVLASQRTSTIPIQLIKSNFGAIPSSCTNPDVAPENVGYNGIIGVGYRITDCASCAQLTNKIYYNCSSTSTNCNNTNIMLSTQYQVTNPIPYLANNNNGVILQLPEVPDTGAVSVRGYMILGIGTQANNTPSNEVQVYPISSAQTFINGNYYPSFFDSGSDGYYFDGPSSLPPCGPSDLAYGWYCPSSLQTLTAVVSGLNGSPSSQINFNIANANDIISVSNPNNVFNNVGGPIPDSIDGYFDWGLPFFLGRTIYVGIQGRSSILGTGPYWAY